MHSYTCWPEQTHAVTHDGQSKQMHSHTWWHYCEPTYWRIQSKVGGRAAIRKTELPGTFWVLPNSDTDCWYHHSQSTTKSHVTLTKASVSLSDPFYVHQSDRGKDDGHRWHWLGSSLSHSDSSVNTGFVLGLCSVTRQKPQPRQVRRWTWSILLFKVRLGVERLEISLLRRANGKMTPRSTAATIPTKKGKEEAKSTARRLIIVSDHNCFTFSST